MRALPTETADGADRSRSQQRGGSTKVDVVTSWNDPDDLGERVVRYLDVRCPSCARMFFCIRWEDYGWPEVHCPACSIRDSWPFEKTGLKQRYRNGGR